MKNVPNENWYYAINVVAQFVTVDDMDKFNAEAGGRPTTDAKELLMKISKKVRNVTVTATDNATIILKGKTLQFNAAVGGTNLTDSEKTVTWSLTGAEKSGTTISETGLLTVASDEWARSLTITATSQQNTEVSGTATVKVKNVSSVKVQQKKTQHT